MSTLPAIHARGTAVRLDVRVTPRASKSAVDGVRDGRLVVQVSEGRHVVEVERDGYDPFTTEVEVREGETRPLNISLRRGGR